MLVVDICNIIQPRGNLLLNIYITNKLDKKRKAKMAEQQIQQPQLAKA